MLFERKNVLDTYKELEELDIEKHIKKVFAIFEKVTIGTHGVKFILAKGFNRNVKGLCDTFKAGTYSRSTMYFTEYRLDSRNLTEIEAAVKILLKKVGLKMSYKEFYYITSVINMILIFDFNHK